MKIRASNGVQYPADQLFALFSEENLKKYYAQKERDRKRNLKRRKGQLDLFEDNV